MHPAAKELMDAWLAVDDARPRSSQGNGFSSLGGCARRAYYEEVGAEKTNDSSTYRLGALIGTAVHTQIEALALPGETEIEVDAGGLKGHVDRFHDGIVTDWKTSKLKSIEWMKRNGPSRQYQWQVQAYGLALLRTGQDVQRVRLVFLPKDGNEGDIYVWESPLDTEVGQQALDWLNEIKFAAERGMIPLPEKPPSFCQFYCPFFGEQCRGLTEVSESMPDGDDPWFEEAARAMLTASKTLARTRVLKDQAQSVLEGVVGRFGRFLVTERRSSSGSYYPFVKEIKSEGK